MQSFCASSRSILRPADCPLPASTSAHVCDVSDFTRGRGCTQRSSLSIASRDPLVDAKPGHPPIRVRLSDRLPVEEVLGSTSRPPLLHMGRVRQATLAVRASIATSAHFAPLQGRLMQYMSVYGVGCDGRGSCAHACVVQLPCDSLVLRRQPAAGVECCGLQCNVIWWRLS